MIRSNTFEKKYALLSPYIEDETLRKNMLSNKDLQRKYDANSSCIMAYLNELDKRFDKETIKGFVIDTIFKFPDEVLQSFITAYLNSNEEAKSNRNVVSFYNKILHYGPEVIKHVEETGIVTSREFKQLPQKLVEDKFNRLNSSMNISYREEPVTNIYSTLSSNEKQILIDYMESGEYYFLEQMFNKYLDLKSLLMLMKVSGVNKNIISKKNIETYGFEGIQTVSAYIFYNVDDNNIKTIVKNIETMLKTQRYDLITSLTNSGMLMYVHYLDETSISNMTEEEMYDTINVSKMILEKTAA